MVGDCFCNLMAVFSFLVINWDGGSRKTGLGSGWDCFIHVFISFEYENLTFMFARFAVNLNILGTPFRLATQKPSFDLQRGFDNIWHTPESAYGEVENTECCLL